VPCDALPEILERLIPYLGKRSPSAAPERPQQIEAPA